MVAATKFVLCRTEWFKRYEEKLLEAYKDNVWPLGADFEPHWCLVLSLDTRWPKSRSAGAPATVLHLFNQTSSGARLVRSGGYVIPQAT